MWKSGDYRTSCSLIRGISVAMRYDCQWCYVTHDFLKPVTILAPPVVFVGRREAPSIDLRGRKDDGGRD